MPLYLNFIPLHNNNPFFLLSTPMKVFAYVKYTAGHYREVQQIVSHYYEQLFGSESDPTYKDESHLCYFTYSPTERKRLKTPFRPTFS